MCVFVKSWLALDKDGEFALKNNAEKAGEAGKLLENGAAAAKWEALKITPNLASFIYIVYNIFSNCFLLWLNLKPLSNTEFSELHDKKLKK